MGLSGWIQCLHRISQGGLLALASGYWLVRQQALGSAVHAATPWLYTVYTVVVHRLTRNSNQCTVYIFLSSIPLSLFHIHTNTHTHALTHTHTRTRAPRTHARTHARTHVRTHARTPVNKDTLHPPTACRDIYTQRADERTIHIGSFHLNDVRERTDVVAAHTLNCPLAEEGETGQGNPVTIVPGPQV